MSANELTTQRPQGTDLPKQTGMAGAVAVAWSMGGGIVLGGFIVAFMTMAGILSANAVHLTSTGLFIVGAFLGFLHGSVLGLFGRDEGISMRSALKGIGLGALYAIPGLAVAWLVTSWIAMTVVAAYLGKVSAYTLVAIGWIAGAVMVAMAAVTGWRALQRAYGRWPEWQLGSALVATTFAALLVLFLGDRPEIWGIRMRVTPVGAVVLAAVVSAWVVGPLVTASLMMIRKLPLKRSVAVIFRGRGILSDVGVAAVVGVVLGLLATPFMHSLAPAASGVPFSEMVVTALSQALVDEVLLRLVVVTGAAWLLLKWQRVGSEEAAVLAVGFAALLQVALYLPGVIQAGFPSALTAAAYVGTAVLLPAVAFGALYWMRGFRSALLAHAAAVLTVILLAV